MIRRRGNSYMVDITSPIGARYRRSFTTKEAAEIWEAQAKLSFASGSSEPPNSKAAKAPEPLTLGELIERTTTRYWQDARSLATIKSNLRTLVDYFGDDRRIVSITEEAVEQYVEHLTATYKPATTNRKLAVLSRLLIYAHRRGWIPAKVDIIRKRETANRIHFYTDDEMREVREGFESLELAEYADLFDYLCDTGLRLGEALALRWEDCTDRRTTVWDGKGTKPGGIPHTDRVEEVLERRRHLVGALSGPFADMSRYQTRYMWGKLRKRMGRDDDPAFVWHTCRHTFCSRLVQAGVNLKAVQDLARHQDISTTLRYTHLAPKDYEDAIAHLNGGR